MTTVVVLGAPRAGHGLLSAVLRALGVEMDASTYNGMHQLNVGLLADCSGSWRTPPTLDALSGTGYRWKHGIEAE